MDETLLAKGLDPSQSQAVFASDRYLLVVAGPGSGKTRVLVSRYAYLLSKGFHSENLLSITFTNRAALEMKGRISALTGLEPSSLRVGTFHAFALEILKELKPGFTLYGRDEQVALLKELGVKDAKKAADRISGQKNLRQALDKEAPASELEGPFLMYQEAMAARGALDLDDLILETVALLESDRGLLDRYGSTIRHVLVDEYQDINPLQSYLVRLISAGAAGAAGVAGVAGAAGMAESGSVFAIGDPDQSIYSFRGANLEGFFSFEEDYPGARVVSLSTNYRSSARIVGASTALIAGNCAERPRPVVRAVKAPGEAITIVECNDDRAEAAYIIKKIETMVGGVSSLTAAETTDELDFSDFAVLFRTRRQGAAIEDAFRASSIPCQLVGPSPGMGEFMRHIKKLRAQGVCPDNGKLGEFVSEQVKVLGMDRAEAGWLAASAARYHDLEGTEAFDGTKALDDFIEELTITTPSDLVDLRASSVLLMTLHMAKGLEFPVVFITGCEDGFLPLKTAAAAQGGVDIEEERRLFYVGMSRARQRLFLLRAKRRWVFGESVEYGRTRFMDELPTELLTLESYARKRPKKRFKQHGLFD